MTTAASRGEPQDDVWRREQQARMAGCWDMLSGILQAGAAAPANADRPRSVPFIVITGFLGAGKTTLLNALLTQEHGKRLAVLVNDFGEINIDALLVAKRSQETISLSNGCTCCSLAGDLAARLAQLTAGPQAPDAIVLEASGLADPHGIVQVALANKSLSVECILAVVDAQAMLEQAEDPVGKRVFMAQLSASDMIVLNKLACVDGLHKARALAWLHAHAAEKPVIAREVDSVPIDIILAPREPLAREAPDTGWLRTPRLASHGFESVSLTVDRPLDRQRLTRLLESVPSAVVRAKGVLQLSDQPGVTSVYQRVGPRWSLVHEPAPEGTPPQSHIVFIAPRGALDARALNTGLEQCVS